MAVGRGVSLKARAIGLLSRREYARGELRRRLESHCSEPEQLEALLDELEQGNLLSDKRYAESMVNRRAVQYGARRIARELRKQGVPDETVSDALSHLEIDEFDRARAVWRKRFGCPPSDAREYARQFRFLAARGFPSDALRRILAELNASLPDLPTDVD